MMFTGRSLEQINCNSCEKVRSEAVEKNVDNMIAKSVETMHPKIKAVAVECGKRGDGEKVSEDRKERQSRSRRKEKKQKAFLREHGQWSVRLVTLLRVNWCAPKIILKDIIENGCNVWT